MLPELQNKGENGFMFPHCLRSTFRIFQPKDEVEHGDEYEDEYVEDKGKDENEDQDEKEDEDVEAEK